MAEEKEEATVKLSDVEKMIQDALDKRDKEHAAEIAEVRQMLPTAMVPANAGGPGVDDHRQSWSLADQELAARGEWADPE